MGGAVAPEDQLDKTQTRTVMRRVLRMAAPFKRTAYVALGCVVVTTSATLAAPILVRHGIDEQLGKLATSEQELRQRLRLENKQVLFLPAVTHPHKNHKFLLQLMKTHWVDKNLVLVCAGGKGRGEIDFMREVRRLNLDDRVIRLDRVADNDRDGLLKLAKALVFPSLYEGFGAPIIEAMQLETPVISSDCAALPEIVGDAGIVLPLDLNLWASALDTVMARRDSLIAAGRIRATHFSVSNSGKDLAQIYRTAI